LLAGAIPAGALADEVSPPESGNPLPATEDEWRFTIAFPMLWTPDIDGKIRGDERIDFSISFDDIIDKLSFGMMFELYANRGPYGLAFRSNYMRVEDENSRSGLLDTRVETGLDMGVNDLLASFRVHDKLRLVATFLRNSSSISTARSAAPKCSTSASR
jgi:hypothetical protein